MKAVTAADEIAGELLQAASVMEADLRRRAREIVYADIGDFEQNLPAVGQPARHKILHHVLLAVDRDAFPKHLAKIDVVQRAAKAQMDAVVRHALALHSLADAAVDQQVARPLLDQTSADAALDIRTTAAFEDDRFDPVQVQEMRQHQSGGPSADDSDLRAHDHGILDDPSAAAKSEIRSSVS